jgi:E3 ubiquitin-protein ligase HUWE1
LIPVPKLRLLSDVELQLYLCGLPELNLSDWCRHTTYRGFTAASPLIRWFWTLVAQMTQLQRANLLYFACSMSRVPAGGFGALNKGGDRESGFRITRVPTTAGVKTDAIFPTAHTCFCELALPEYSSPQVLQEKLEAICQQRAQAEGFGLI